MLWNRNKPTEPSRPAVNPGNASGYRVAEPDRALTAIGTLLTLYGRFAFDAVEAASSLRERCDEWAQRLMLGEGRRPGAADAATGGGAEGAPAASVSRDFRGVERFFEEVRKGEAAFVHEQLGGLRRTVLALARTLGNGVGEDRDADAQLEQQLSGLSQAVEQGDIRLIARTATSVIETSRTFMAQRRQRETRHVQKLDQELRTLRDKLSTGYDKASSDELTGLFGRTQDEQQLDQLSAIGALLEEPPWLLLIDVAAGKRETPKRDDGKADGAKRRPVPDATLREVSHCISRTFLRRHDFAARSGAHELAVLVVDMTQAEVVAATERLLGVVHNAGRSLGKSETPTVSIGLARLRPNDDPERWEARARVGVERAIQDGRDGYALGAG
jgi:diguanylate cyclase (GGDEF)-like protein